ncbi:MAG: hypothetical protein JWL96_4644 [Sphingomonas bacterium]|jgi:hypothetical protein|uniref:PilZ domain-containing protein n=1 Tax=Sphingomonas bacterium TaxID=1895847 RepID=UPI0026295C19|nr:PilZ domain-containing protein [Sphingomonas bacterium]MDB5712574.1 hypothetical protein [Sphingomonas bacterium]
MASRATQYRTVAAASFEQRAEPRHAVRLSRAEMRRTGKGTFDAQLHDISIYGCRVSCAQKPPVGERIWVRLADGPPIAAATIWCGDGFVGCRFDVPINRALVRSLTIGIAVVES